MDRIRLVIADDHPVVSVSYETAVCPVCGQVLRVGYGLLLPEHEPAEQPVSP